MLKKLSLIGAALAMTGTAIVPATQAAAQSRYEYRDGRGYDRGYNRSYDRRSYDRRDYRGQDRRYASRNRSSCRDNGDGGTVIGAIAGGLIGNEVAGRGDKTAGTLLGGVLGALAGRAIDRSDRPDYCRR